MKTHFVATAVPVLNLSHKPDMQGHVIPPEAHVTFNKSVQVFYGPEDIEHYAGNATLSRVGDQILADFALVSTWADVAKTEKAIARLYPATCFRVLEAVGPGIFKLHIDSLTLTPHGNVDTTIPKLEARLSRLPSKGELN